MWRRWAWVGFFVCVFCIMPWRTSVGLPSKIATEFEIIQRDCTHIQIKIERRCRKWGSYRCNIDFSGEEKNETRLVMLLGISREGVIKTTYYINSERFRNRLPAMESMYYFVVCGSGAYGYDASSWKVVIWIDRKAALTGRRPFDLSTPFRLCFFGIKFGERNTTWAGYNPTFPNAIDSWNVTDVLCNDIQANESPAFVDSESRRRDSYASDFYPGSRAGDQAFFSRDSLPTGLIKTSESEDRRETCRYCYEDIESFCITPIKLLGCAMLMLCGMVIIGVSMTRGLRFGALWLIVGMGLQFVGGVLLLPF